MCDTPGLRSKIILSSPRERLGTPTLTLDAHVTGFPPDPSRPVVCGELVVGVSSCLHSRVVARWWGGVRIDSFFFVAHEAMGKEC